MHDHERRWRYVKSSNVKVVRYCRDGSKLYVRFLGGSEYVYYGVPKKVYVQLLHAKSVGKYLARAIKGRYRYARLLSSQSRKV